MASESVSALVHRLGDGGECGETEHLQYERPLLRCRRTITANSSRFRLEGARGRILLLGMRGERRSKGQAGDRTSAKLASCCSQLATDPNSLPAHFHTTAANSHDCITNAPSPAHHSPTWMSTRLRCTHNVGAHPAATHAVMQVPSAALQASTAPGAASPAVIVPNVTPAAA
jgi:hypothetical protein